MIRLLLLAAALVAMGTPAAPGPSSETAKQVIEQARQACTAYNGGQFATGAGAITEVDLTGDGAAEVIVDESSYSCSTAASMYCGTGGCLVRIITGGQITKRLAKGWRLIEWGSDRIMLLALHGTECGGSGVDRCYEALIWSGDRFLSVR